MSAQQIDEKKLERVIRKIKHCLALAQSANENEAATALRQAQALMREYRLTDMDVKLSICLPNNAKTWKQLLASIIRKPDSPSRPEYRGVRYSKEAA